MMLVPSQPPSILLVAILLVFASYFIFYWIDSSSEFILVLVEDEDVDTEVFYDFDDSVFGGSVTVSIFVYFSGNLLLIEGYGYF